MIDEVVQKVVVNLRKHQLIKVSILRIKFASLIMVISIVCFLNVKTVLADSKRVDIDSLNRLIIEISKAEVEDNISSFLPYMECNKAEISDYLKKLGFTNRDLIDLNEAIESDYLQKFSQDKIHLLSGENGNLIFQLVLELEYITSLKSSLSQAKKDRFFPKIDEILKSEIKFLDYKSGRMILSVFSTVNDNKFLLSPQYIDFYLLYKTGKWRIKSIYLTNSKRFKIYDYPENFIDIPECLIR